MNRIVWRSLFTSGCRRWNVFISKPQKVFITMTMQLSPPAKRSFLTAEHELRSVDIDKKNEIIEGIVSYQVVNTDKDTMIPENETKLVSCGENQFEELPFACSSLEGDVSVTDKSEEKGEASGKKKKSKKQKKKKEKMAKVVPNYFIAVQITDETIITNIKKVQESILTVEKKLKQALIPVATLHLTLCVLRINNDEEIKQACDILETCGLKVIEFLRGKKLELTFEGLDHFRNQVLFAKLKDDENAKTMAAVADIVYSCFDQSEFLIHESKTFTAHLTIAKLSKAPHLRRQNIKNIAPECYKDHVSVTFGKDCVKSLQLLSMTKPKSSDGYYFSVKEVPVAFYFNFT